jgi:hypothetical protein
MKIQISRRLQIAAIVGIITIIVTSCGSDRSSAAPEGSTNRPDYPGYSSLTELFNSADLVIQAKIGSTPKIQKLEASSAEGDDPKANPNAGVDP